MFRKPLEGKQSHQLKNSTKKKLAAQIEQIYHSKPDIQQVIKFETDIYSSSDDPLIFLYQEKLIPTVYFQWLHKGVKIITTPNAVIERLVNGADLMIPGIVEYEEFEKEDIICVCPVNSDIAYCVGIALISSADLQTMTHGKAVKSLHWFGDCLWDIGSRKVPGAVENLIEIRNVVEPKVALDLEKEMNQEYEQFSQKEIDEYLEKKFLLALSNQSLPEMASKVYSDMVKDSSICDIKRSSFKKLSKFIKSLDKKGLLTSKEKLGELFITQIHSFLTLKHYLLKKCKRPS
jgi:translation initiation factor 2D